MRELSDYDDEVETTYYVWREFSHLRNSVEKRSALVAFFREKNKGRTSGRMYREMMRAGADDPDVVEALKDGYRPFVFKAVKRLLRESPEQISVNRCRRCEKVLRTPRAMQCLWCNHSWHKADLNDDD